MTAAHTPAPWLIAEDDGTFVYALGPGGTNLFWAQVQAAGPEKISDDEKIANARLITAAPDLLAALQTAEMAMLGYTTRNAVLHTALTTARAAIVKATMPADPYAGITFDTEDMLSEVPPCANT